MPYLNHPDFTEAHAAIAAAMDALSPSRNNEESDAYDLLNAAHIKMGKAIEGVASPELRNLAEELHGSNKIEIDDDGVGTSSSDDGTWVQAWVWVSREELAHAGLVSGPVDVDGGEDDDDPDYDENGNLHAGVDNF